MTTIQVAISLKKLLDVGGIFYFKCEPEILDFTHVGQKCNLIIYAGIEEFRLPLLPNMLFEYMGLLSAAFFQNDKISIICWNIKNFVSYIKYYTKALPEFECKILDLKIIEAFCGKKKEEAPKDFAEAFKRVKVVFSDESWKIVYNKIHKPLILKVIPTLETQGVYNKEKREALYSYYEIEGQSNGRLCNQKVFNKCFLPHSLGPYEKEVFRPKGMDEMFMYLDYHNMEIAVLQWLSGDEHLGQILDLDEDLYKVVFKLVSGTDCDNDKKRNFCKNFLIGIIYGQSANSLSQIYNISLTTAESIVNRVHGLFPKAMKWLQNIQDSAGDIVKDIFGRKRFLDQKYLARNFIVQSPASLICLEKLINLYDNIKCCANMLCSIHDGYLLCVNKAKIKMVASLAKEVLEEASKLAPNLKLKSSCKVGLTLAELKFIE